MKKSTIKNILFILGFMLVICILLFTITFIDTALDVKFILNGERKVVLEYGEKYEESGYKVTVRGKEANCVRVSGNLNEDKVGNYKINYVCHFGFYYKRLTRKVSIVDTVPPEITFEDGNDIYITTNEKYDIKYTAVDNYDGDIRGKVSISSNLDITHNGDYYADFIVKDSSNNKTVQRINIHVTNEFEHTYIKVSISDQKIRYYVRNKVVIESDIVTGKNGATKKGSFKVQKKVRNATLKGKDYVSFVKYWIQYNGSFGIHDASWRNSFGGNIYKSNGSHGCVNLPTQTAADLYELVEIGTPVYIE